MGWRHLKDCLKAASVLVFLFDVFCLYPHLYPRFAPDAIDADWTILDDNLLFSQRKTPPDRRYQMALDRCMVELGGFEPPSANLPRADLHV